MEVLKKYKIYASIFYAYILFYIILFVIVMRLKEVSLISDGFLFYFIILFGNKTLLFYQQIIEDNFGFFAFDLKSEVKNRFRQFFGFSKSFLGILVYSSANLGLLDMMLVSNISHPILDKIVYTNIALFFFILLAWDIKRWRYWPLLEKERVQSEQQEVDEEVERRRQQHLAYAKKMELEETRQDQPKENGEMTGYEPKQLAEINLDTGPFMYGEPGAGLSGSGFSEGNIKAGALGELNFAKVLQKNNLLASFASYWSVQYPEANGPGPDRDMQGDIDCVLISEEHIYLVDLKLYAQGNVTWEMTDSELAIQAVDNVTGNWVGEPKRMTKNMYYATQRIQRKVDQLAINKKVIPYVVMMPTDRGIGKVDNVSWPNYIACLTVMDFLQIIENDQPFKDDTEDAVLLNSIFKWLIKDESGHAPSI